MYSRHRAVLSLVLAGTLLVVAPPSVDAAVLVAVVLAAGVGIDFDHFLIARFVSGSWTNARRVRRDPSLPVLDQRAIFDDGDVPAAYRLLSHLLLGGAAVGGSWFLAPYWAGVVAATLSVHVVADIFSDVRRRAQGSGAPVGDPQSP